MHVGRKASLGERELGLTSCQTSEVDVEHHSLQKCEKVSSCQIAARGPVSAKVGEGDGGIAG